MVRVNYVRVDVRAVPTWQTQKTLIQSWDLTLANPIWIVLLKKNTHTHASYRLSAVFAGFEE